MTETTTPPSPATPRTEEVTRTAVSVPKRLRKGRSGATGVAGRFDPGHRGEAQKRNPLWLAGGLLLVVLCALGGVLLFANQDERVQVLVAARALEPGKKVTRDAFMVAEILPDENAAVLVPSDRDALLGSQPTGRIPAGTVVNAAMFAEDVPLEPGEMVVGAALEPGAAPVSRVQVDTPVELIVVGNGRAESVGRGTVWAVDPLGSGGVWLSVRVPELVGLEAAQAASQDRLRVALVGAEDE